ncbi:MAG TPA: hypothetical protein VMB34_23245 [Acetobacteraceae bacterium]|nr:hypothetical protein [Acetobacteraceae bacterium]
MRNQAAPARAVSCRATGYPAPSDRHPIYLYGAFAPGSLPVRPTALAEQAMLWKRENGAARPVHPHQHADVCASDGHRFMFGSEAEQGTLVPPEEPVFFFWDVGAA